MYGLVNRAVEDMVCRTYGEAVWLQIKAAASVETEVFVSNEAYPDELTYRLVSAASAVLDIPADEVLSAFGVYWVHHTGREGYGDLMAAGGATLPEFLINLPGFHARVALIYPDLKPPTFVISDVTPTSLHFHYYSHRQGLQPLTAGILRGLAQMFETDAQITALRARAAGADHDEFLIEWEDPGLKAAPFTTVNSEMVTL